ncbi:hypothetical protein EsDP_00000970 [Epichloe bromicola]|uniref:Ribosomal RNA-processing protein 8 n=1 Tax=Epichloe bromicola TaxID=79588 RepID=A0ABQ0CGH3_9HYPO
MFAVPGWSVSADALKPETSSAKAGSGPSASKSRKRKRGNGPGAESQNVTAANVADLYESVVEGRGEVEGKAIGKAEGNKASGDDAAAPAKRMKKNESSAASGSASALTSCPRSTAESKKGRNKTKTKNKNNEASSSKQGNKDNKDRERDKDGKEEKHAKGQNKSLNEDAQVVSAPDEGNSKPSNAPSSSARASKLDGAAQSSLPPAAPSKLTPLQASMREKLISARFRHLNETLYTKPSAEAFGLFQDSPEMFDEYHEGFRRQVKVWPENPVDSFLSDIRSRAKARPPIKGGRPGPPPPSQRSKMALPRTMGTCTIADLGCGDARLAESLQKESAKLRLDVKSFDLQSPSPLVTKADIANLPLEDGSVNIAIFCLALMGTNWIDFVEEAYRVLHWKGELWVAEIKSRFGPVRKNAVVEHSVGNRRKNNVALSKKAKLAQAAQAGALHGEDLAVEVDGSEDRRRETDVTAFIEALQKRGFILQGERAEAVDLSNRMFVKMHFIKGASPTKGKGVQLQGDKMQGQSKKKKDFAPKWDEVEAEDKDGNEASILKPCVYKIR